MPYKVPACAGKPYRPSNGMEGEEFKCSFCYRCKFIQGNPPTQGGHCSIELAVLINDVADPEFPKEWTHTDEGEPTCTAFEHILKGE